MPLNSPANKHKCASMCFQIRFKRVPDNFDRYQKFHRETIIVFIKYYFNVEVTEKAQRKYDRNLIIGSLQYE